MDLQLGCCGEGNVIYFSIFITFIKGFCLYSHDKDSCAHGYVECYVPMAMYMFMQFQDLGAKEFLLMIFAV